MGSLRDSNDFGAEPVDNQPFYSAVRSGMGRWAILERLGVLWTDDQDALQLSRLDGADQAAAYQFRLDLHALAAANVLATTAFDRLVTERAATVTSGNLADIPSDS